MLATALITSFRRRLLNGKVFDFGSRAALGTITVLGDTRTFRINLAEFPFHPVFSEQFNRMLCSNRSVPAPKVVRGAVFIAAPAYALGVFGIERYFRFRHPFSRV